MRPVLEGRARRSPIGPLDPRSPDGPEAGKGDQLVGAGEDRDRVELHGPEATEHPRGSSTRAARAVPARRERVFAPRGRSKRPPVRACHLPSRCRHFASPPSRRRRARPSSAADERRLRGPPRSASRVFPWQECRSRVDPYRHVGASGPRGDPGGPRRGRDSGLTGLHRHMEAAPHEIPRIPAAAGALIFDAAGRLLVLKPTYKAAWTIPGGQIEVDGETPWEACRREAREESGVEIDNSVARMRRLPPASRGPAGWHALPVRLRCAR